MRLNKEGIKILQIPIVFLDLLHSDTSYSSQYFISLMILCHHFDTPWYLASFYVLVHIRLLLLSMPCKHYFSYSLFFTPLCFWVPTLLNASLLYDAFNFLALSLSLLFFFIFFFSVFFVLIFLFAPVAFIDLFNIWSLKFANSLQTYLGHYMILWY